MLRRFIQYARQWLAGDEIRRDQDPERPDPDPVTEDGPRPGSEESPTDLPNATPDTAGRRHLIAQARAQGVDDAIRHEEDLLELEILPIVAEVDASRRGRLDELRVEWSNARLRLDEELARAARALEHAEAALLAIEASLLNEGVHVEALALPPRRGLPVLLQHALAALGTGALVAAGAHQFELPTDVVLVAAAAAVAVMALLAALLDRGERTHVTALRRRRSRAEQTLDRARETHDALAHELDELPERIAARAQVELDLPAEQLAAYESGVLSALPPGAFGPERHLRPRQLPPMAVPDWVPDVPNPTMRTPFEGEGEVAA